MENVTANRVRQDRTHEPEGELNVDQFRWALGNICRAHGVPFEPGLVLQRFPPPHDLHALVQAARELGFRCELRQAEPEQFLPAPTPWIAAIRKTRNGPAAAPDGFLPADRFPHSGENSETESNVRLVLVVGKDDTNVIISTPEDGPRPLEIKEFLNLFTGCAVLAAPAVQAPADAGAVDDREARFGFRWFIPELLRHKKIWRDVLLASLAIQLMGLATPLFTQVVIDKVVVHQTTSTLIVIAAALGLFMAFTAAMSWTRQYLVLHTGNRIDAVLGIRVFGHLLHLPARYFEQRPTGVLIARVHGVETIREFVSGAAVTLVLDVPFLVIFLAVMFYYSWLLSLISVAALAAIAVLSVGVVPVLRKRLNHQFLLGARNQAFLTEYVSGMETVKSLQMEPQLRKRFGDYLASYLHAGFNARQLSNTYNVAANSLEQLQTLAILCAGAWLVMRNDGFTIGMLVAFQMFASRMSQPLLRLVGLWQESQQAAIAVKRLGDIMNAPAEPHSLVPSRESATKGRVEIRGLAFRYGVTLPWLYRGLDLGIEPGTCVALMGPSGSGKSTLAKLLQGFYPPSDGQILLDGRDIRNLPANELRQNFGVVPQETVLFSGTVYDNLALANPHASFEQIVQACKLAEIHDTIESLPEGYQTKIGEHGAGLSGGQKQRIAIARALLKRPRILIFDEATSSLDPATAEQLARTVNQFRGRVTILFVAHQLPKGLKVDEVVRLGGSEPRMDVVKGDRNDG
ncbi:MAG: peptidase domain-containing ABC transporter [Betaproteobacteria bacterium]|nr:peptidase domain-containing ABC transporter [Betaproteobacteria bacterium]